jgi:NhaP-type Na+/H+ or K+/H+ antiporter
LNSNIKLILGASSFVLGFWLVLYIPFYVPFSEDFSFDPAIFLIAIGLIVMIEAVNSRPGHKK